MVNTQDIRFKKSGGGLVSENPLSSTHPRAANPLALTRPHATAALTQVKPQPSAPSRAPAVSLRSGDTLWEIAQKKLGDGTRWRELQKADGSQFTGQEAKRLKVGTQVYLPGTNSTHSRATTVSIRRGDTLREIAQRKLGDGNRWRELQKADGSQFTGQEARRLQVGTGVYLPGAKPTTQTSHPVNSFSQTPHLRTESITRRELTPGSTNPTRSNLPSASPAFFSRTSQVSSQLLSSKGVKRGEYFLADSHQRRNTQSGDSSNTWNNVVTGTLKGQAVAKLFPNQPAVRVSRHPKEPGAKPSGPNGRQMFRRDIAKIIGTAIDNQKSHPLQDLVEKDKRNQWKLKTEYEAGHLTSNHSGRREMFAVEARRFNNGDSALENKGKILKKLAVDIGGVPVEWRSAKMLEKQGVLPKGTVKIARSHPGWTRGVQVKHNAIDRIASHVDLSNPVNQQRIQELRNIANKPQLLQGRRTRKVAQLYEFYTRSLRDVVHERKRTSGTRFASRRIGGESIQTRVPRLAREVKQSKAYNSALRVTRSVGADRLGRGTLQVARAAKESKFTTGTLQVARAAKESKFTTGTLQVAKAAGKSGVTKGILRGASRAALPVAVGLDAWQLKNAYQKDGFGKEFRKTAGSVAGAWGGAAAGAAIGSAIFPGVGTVAGGIIGGIAGSSVGDDIVEGAEKVGKKVWDGGKKVVSKLNPFD